jgi:hypothetical protein
LKQAGLGLAAGLVLFAVGASHIDGAAAAGTAHPDFLWAPIGVSTSSHAVQPRPGVLEAGTASFAYNPAEYRVTKDNN